MLWCNRTKEVDKRFSCDVKTRGTVSSIMCSHIEPKYCCLVCVVIMSYWLLKYT